MLVVVDLTQGTTRLKKLNDDKVHVILFDDMDRLPRYVRGWGIESTEVPYGTKVIKRDLGIRTRAWRGSYTLPHVR